MAIAEHLAGSVPQFAGWMNEKAEEIGCTEAHFVTPNGLDGEDVWAVCTAFQLQIWQKS
ncbi:MAG: hypothetical protein ACLR2O_03060 [Coprococcus sp.]